MSFNNSHCTECNNIQGKECNKECKLNKSFPMEKLQRYESVKDVFGTRKVAETLNVINVKKPKDLFKDMKDNGLMMGMDVVDMEPYENITESTILANKNLTDADFFNAFGDDFDDGDIN